MAQLRMLATPLGFKSTTAYVLQIFLAHKGIGPASIAAHNPLSPSGTKPKPHVLHAAKPAAPDKVELMNKWHAEHVSLGGTAPAPSTSTAAPQTAKPTNLFPAATTKTNVGIKIDYLLDAYLLGIKIDEDSFGVSRPTAKPRPTSPHRRTRPALRVPTKVGLLCSRVLSWRTSRRCAAASS